MYSRSMSTMKPSTVSKASEAYLRPAAAISKARQSVMSMGRRGKRSAQSASGRGAPVSLGDEPNMSDTTLLVTMEDLIRTAFGKIEEELKVDFKKMHSVLMTMASHMDMMERLVDVRLAHREIETSTQDLSHEKSLLRREKSKVLSREKSKVLGREKSRVLGREKSVMAKFDSDKEEEGSPTQIGSIEAVSLAQYRIVEAAIKVLQNKANSMGPNLPASKMLMTDIMTGSASVSYTVDVMKVNARVEQAEIAITRISELISELAHVGALPAELAAQAATIKQDVETLVKEAAKAAVKTTDDAISIQQLPPPPEKKAKPEKIKKAGKAEKGEKAESKTQVDAVSQVSVTSRPLAWRSHGRKTAATSTLKQAGLTSRSPTAKATSVELDDAVHFVREDIHRRLKIRGARALTTADAAIRAASAVQEGLEKVQSVDERLDKVKEMVDAYKKELDVLDTGLYEEVKSFEEPLAQMHIDLEAGLSKLPKKSKNLETAVVLALKDVFDGLVNDFERALEDHTRLEDREDFLYLEVEDLHKIIKTLNIQKCERDEFYEEVVLKADMVSVVGMVQDSYFEVGREELDMKMKIGLEKLRRMDDVWMETVRDFHEVTALKANVSDLLNEREIAQLMLRDMHHKVQLLRRFLGDPKAAVICRKLTMEASCGSCKEPAKLEPRDPRSDGPRPLPALRPLPASAKPDEVSLRQLIPIDDDKKHVCHRWSGGSHTRATRIVDRERHHRLAASSPGGRSFFGVGSKKKKDGKSYMLGKDLLAYEECELCRLATLGVVGSTGNTPAEIGAGDQAFFKQPPSTETKKSSKTSVTNRTDDIAPALAKSSHSIDVNSSNMFLGIDSNVALSTLRLPTNDKPTRSSYTPILEEEIAEEEIPVELINVGGFTTDFL